MYLVFIYIYMYITVLLTCNYFPLDVLVWTNDHVIQWVESLGLADFATNLRECGVHGGVIALDSDFDHDKLALALQIPLASTEVREGKTEGGKEREREAWRERERKEGRKGRRGREREGARERGREKGRECKREKFIFTMYIVRNVSICLR